MPNHCWNKLSVIGPHFRIDEFEKRANGPQHTFPVSVNLGASEHKPKTSVLSFNALVPLPADVLLRKYDQPDLRTDEETGFDWEQRMWGVKWGASDASIEARRDGLITYSFRTAWGPPLTFIWRLSWLYPDLCFVCSFGEQYPSRGRFWYQGGTELGRVGDRDRCELRLSDFGDEKDEDEDEFFRQQAAWRDALLQTHDAFVSQLEL